MPTKGLPVLERFLTHVTEMESGCHLWTGTTVESRPGHVYGRFKVAGKNVLAHRWRYQQANPSLDMTSLVMRHRCDTPLCVRLDHLTHGTQQENVDDCSARGRAWWQT